MSRVGWEPAEEFFWAESAGLAAADEAGEAAGAVPRQNASAPTPTSATTTDPTSSGLRRRFACGAGPDEGGCCLADDFRPMATHSSVFIGSPAWARFRADP